MKSNRLVAPVVLLSLIGVLSGCAASQAQTYTAPTSEQISPECATAFAAAEAEAATDDTAILSTLDVCGTSESWIAGIQARPGAGSLTSYTRTDAVALLDLACIRRVDAPVCTDASTRGLLTFEMDDPRLPGLQVPRS